MHIGFHDGYSWGNETFIQRNVLWGGGDENTTTLRFVSNHHASSEASMHVALTVRRFRANTSLHFISAHVGTCINRGKVHMRTWDQHTKGGWDEKPKTVNSWCLHLSDPHQVHVQKKVIVSSWCYIWLPLRSAPRWCRKRKNCMHANDFAGRVVCMYAVAVQVESVALMPSLLP